MTGIASFSRVSPAQYAQDAAAWPDALPLADIPLPCRATQGAAGYDFVCPTDFHLLPGETVLLPTGIRAWMEPGWVLMLFPRSSLGFKHRLMLCNTVGVVDSDYFHARNEGHILVKLTNAGDHPVDITRGERFCQGIFLPYGLTREDRADAERTGGFGSTGA